MHTEAARVALRAFFPGDATQRRWRQHLDPCTPSFGIMFMLPRALGTSVDVTLPGSSGRRRTTGAPPHSLSLCLSGCCLFAPQNKTVRNGYLLPNQERNLYGELCRTLNYGFDGELVPRFIIVPIVLRDCSLSSATHTHTSSAGHRGLAKTTNITCPGPWRGSRKKSTSRLIFCGKYFRHCAFYARRGSSLDINNDGFSWDGLAESQASAGAAKASRSS